MDRAWKLGVDMLDTDTLCDGVTFDDIITAVQCNCREVTEAAVMKEAIECKRMREEDFFWLLTRNMNEIIAEVNRRKGIENET
jgi:hypothetical protein